jgi:hypothetical protein
MQHSSLLASLISDEENLILSKSKTWAAGLPAVVSSLKHILGEAGPLRGTHGLMEMNQAGGFDCPSCAWPAPDGDRSLAEFCENGTNNLLDCSNMCHESSGLAMKDAVGIGKGTVTLDFEAYASLVRETPWAEICRMSGVGEMEIRALAMSRPQ